MTEPAVNPVLIALLGALLPGDEDWPAAALTQAPAFVAKRAAASSEFGKALDALCTTLPLDFAGRDLVARTAALRETEARMPDLFAQLVIEAYRGYYSDAVVLAVLERKTGYPARPPQPLGRTVRPTDWSALTQRSIGTAPLPPLIDALRGSYEQ